MRQLLPSPRKMLLAVLLVGCAQSGDVRTTPKGDDDTDPSATDDDDDTDPGDDDDDDDDEEAIFFAILGDFGTGGTAESEVAALIALESPDFIVTVGDNNYPDGEASTIDDHIGRFYSDWIGSYQGSYGPGASTNRFFPCPGNHDWNTDTLQPYLDYFPDLPGNGRYYTVERGPLALFCVDSDFHEPDGVETDSAQADWLRDAMAATDAPFKVVSMHHPPFSSGYHGNSSWMQWSFAGFGADVVLSGHDHNYERLTIDDRLYIVQGLGGAGLRDMYPAEPGSQFMWTAEHGATFVTMTDDRATFRTLDVVGNVVDEVMVKSVPVQTDTVLVPSGATWRYTTDYPGAGWAAADFDDSGWSTGAGPLGYGEGTEATELDSGAQNLWARITFDAPPAEHLRMRLRADDGAVVWLNGTEVHRRNMRAGGLNAVTQAASTVCCEWEGVLAATLIDERLLVDGDNVLAVTVRQVGVGSSDLQMELQLEASE